MAAMGAARSGSLALAVLIAGGSLVPWLVAPAAGQGRGRVDFDAAARRARSLLGDLVAADTTNPPGNETRAVRLGAAQLRQAGIRYEVSEFEKGRGNLVARLEGDGSARPLLILAHIDVVGARGQAWSTDPHRMIEKDGHLIGRGVSDDLGMAAVALEVMRLLAQNRVPLRRDVILAWTGDEESGGKGIRWLVQHKRSSIDAELAINEGGGIVLDDSGRPKLVALQMAEKTYQDFEISARGPTGHSSVPLDENAIYRLSRALDRLGKHRFAARLLPVTRAFFAGRADREPPALGRAMRALASSRGRLPAGALAIVEADPILRANLRTTCVATLVSGGTRENALPAAARANVNCRILPDETSDDVRRQLVQIIADPQVRVRALEDSSRANPSPLEGPGPAAIRKIIGEMYPGIPVIPAMGRGATDSRHLRAIGIASYGLVPMPNTEANARRAHGIDERIPTASLRSGVELLYRLVIELAARRDR
jgi:acetylornithine deacetylase/succinyl-diaminopimelate desuccinylase-like protein